MNGALKYAMQLLKLSTAVAALDEHFGYEPEWDHEEGYVCGWYCRGPQCSQLEGKPHLDGCPVGALDAALRKIEP